MADSWGSDEPVAAQLARCSGVVHRLGDLPLALYRAGLRLTSVEFDGAVDGSEVRQNWAETELQRERYGRWRVRRAEDCFESIGYTSDRLQAELAVLGLDRRDLTDPSRSESLGHLIASTRWGQPFLRERLLWSRSCSLGSLVQQEKENGLFADYCGSKRAFSGSAGRKLAMSLSLT